MRRPWDIDSNNDSAEDIRNIFADNGVLVIRQALDKATFGQFQHWLAEYVALIERQVRENAPEVQANPGLVTAVARGVVHHSLLSQYLFKNGVGIIDMLAKVVHGSRLQRIIGYLLGNAVLLDEYSVLRYKEPAKAEGFIPFHQDAPSASTISPPTLTCFTTFCDTGVDAPGIEFVPERCTELFDVSSQPRTQFAGLELDEDFVKGRWGNILVAPHLNAGDVVIMGPLTVHRSQPAPVTWKPRGSADLRFVSASPVPEKYKDRQGFDLSTGKRLTLA